jgi:antitoxin (DNA-binding transcriptional repressor) of toxin-antitoxin stability system
MPATVLLTTTMDWPFPAQLAGAFAGAGATVEALCPKHTMLWHSRHPGRVHRHHALAPEASLRKAIATAGPDLIIPCDDLAAEILRGVRGGEDLANRHAFLRRAAEAGAPAGKTIALADEAMLEDAMREFGLPLVLKCDHSWGGDGVAIASTAEEAHAAFRRFHQTSRLRNLIRAVRRGERYFLTRALSPVTPVISAQRFIDGHPATSSIACWQGEVVAAHHFDVLGASGATAPACVIARRDCAAMQASAIVIAREFNLSGLFGLDYMRDRQGDVHLLEINARATPTAHLMLKQDLPAALLKAAGLPSHPRAPMTDKDEIAIFPREWLRDPASPWLKSAYHDVPWDDPEVVRACVRTAPAANRAAAQALFEAANRPVYPKKDAVFGI